MSMSQLDGATPLWVAARTLLIERGDDFKQHLEQVLSTFDPEAIHDLRVSSRRLREGIALFAPCYPPVEITLLVKMFRKITRLLGEIRNRDEAVLFFTALSMNLDRRCCSELDRLLTAYERERKNEVQRLTSGLQKYLAADLFNRYRKVVSSPRLFMAAAAVDPFTPLIDFARHALCTRMDDVLQLVPAAGNETDIAAQHQLRISVKHFRYRLELFSFLLGSSYRKIYTQLKSYQELLGTMHDLDVFAAINRENSFSPPVTARIAAEIATRRSSLFTAFSMLLTNKPFEKIGEKIRACP